MKSIKIQGKDYIEVNERVKYFRELYPLGEILTHLESDNGEKCTFKAEILVDGVCVSTGHAYEMLNVGFVNKTSYIENCETSAVGRALGFLGIGIDTGIASADEVKNAIESREKSNSNTQIKKNKSLEPNVGLQVSDEIVTFGKNKGKPWKSVPDSFLDWVIESFDNPSIIEIAKNEAQKRLSEADMGDNINYSETEEIPF